MLINSLNHLFLLPPLLAINRCLKKKFNNLDAVYYHISNNLAVYCYVSTILPYYIRSSQPHPKHHLGISSSSSKTSLLPHLEVFTIFIVSPFSLPVCFRPAKACKMSRDHDFEMLHCAMTRRIINMIVVESKDCLKSLYGGSKILPRLQVTKSGQIALCHLGRQIRKMLITMMVMIMTLTMLMLMMMILMATTMGF